jgi:hypothetical protein
MSPSFKRKQAVVDKHAGELLANGAVNEGRRHRGIHAAGQAEDDFFVAHLGADFVNRFLDVVAHHPVGPGAANVQHKTVQQGLALQGVRDLGVELHGVEPARFVGHAGNGAAGCGGHELEAGWHLGDFVAVAHPDLEHAMAFGRGEVGNVLEQGSVTVGAHLGVAEFPGVRTLDLAAQLVGHGLHAVANAQHRQAQLVHRLGRFVVYLVDAGVRARQDDALEMAVLGVLTHPVARHITGMDFAKHMGFAHTAGNQLGDLRAEVEDEDFLVGHRGYESKKRGCLATFKAPSSSAPRTGRLFSFFRRRWPAVLCAAWPTRRRTRRSNSSQ